MPARGSLTQNRQRSFYSLALACYLALGCHSTANGPIRLFAAVSTKEALEQIATQFHEETGITVELNLGPSSDLARQVEYGSSADLFLSADEAWANYLASKDLVEERRNLLTNRLVVVVPATSMFELQTLADAANPAVRRLALAGPAVPAGRYAREALRHAKVWGDVEKRVLDGGDVRATLAYVVRGEAEAGFVYATDVTANTKVRVAFYVQPEYHTPIRYPLVLIRQSPLKTGALRLFDYLGSAASTETFRKAGFGIVRE